jgi:prepilin-type processing-associated H-X9-DG protein
MALADAGGHLRYPNEVSAWMTKEFGRLGGPWLCPVAAATNERRATRIQGTVLGTVRSAFSTSDWGWENMGGEQRLVLTSYTFNFAVTTLATNADSLNDGQFFEESQVKPAMTPLFGDGILDVYGFDPLTRPPVNLFNPAEQPPPWVYGINAWGVPRHGNHPDSVPTRWPANQRLPGQINMAFFDGHVSPVKLEDLWQLYWYQNYSPPAKRPGL